MLLNRYGSGIEYIINLDFEEGFLLIEKAMQESLDDKVWERWLAEQMPMSFDDYKSKIVSNQKEEIKPLKSTEIDDVLERYASYIHFERKEV